MMSAIWMNWVKSEHALQIMPVSLSSLSHVTVMQDAVTRGESEGTERRSYQFLQLPVNLYLKIKSKEKVAWVFPPPNSLPSAPFN